jgi:hypothetical protein
MCTAEALPCLAAAVGKRVWIAHMRDLILARWRMEKGRYNTSETCGSLVRRLMLMHVGGSRGPASSGSDI